MGVRDRDAVAGPGDHRHVREVIAEGNHPAFRGSPRSAACCASATSFVDTGRRHLDERAYRRGSRLRLARRARSSRAGAARGSADGNRARSFVIGNVHSRGSHGGCEPSGRGHQPGRRCASYAGSLPKRSSCSPAEDDPRESLAQPDHEPMGDLSPPEASAPRHARCRGRRRSPRWRRSRVRRFRRLQRAPGRYGATWPSR